MPRPTDYLMPPNARSADVFRILAFGSSSTQGVGASSPAKTYPAQLQQLFETRWSGKPAIEVVNRGVAGDDIAAMLKRLQSDALSRKPDLIVWQVGSNDPLHKVPLEIFKDDLRSGIAAIRATGTEVMLMEPQWCPQIAAIDVSGRYLAAVRAVAQDQKVPLIPRFDLMQAWMAKGLVSQKELIGPDGLHMTDRGYQLLAGAVLDEISNDSIAFRNKMPPVIVSGHS